jgi:hypothetical protein
MTSRNTTKEQILMSDKKRKNVGGQPFFVWCSTLTLHTRNPPTRFSDETLKLFNIIFTDLYSTIFRKKRTIKNKTLIMTSLLLLS